MYNMSNGDAGACRSVGTPPPGLTGCGNLYALQLEGDASACGFTPSPSQTVCQTLCKTNADFCNLVEDGGQAVSCGFPCAAGRRPAGLRDAAVHGSDVGAYFARAAWLEAASVDAFEALAAELEAHGAPGSLVAAARRSARDEVRHARAMTRAARRFGADVPRASVAPRAPRALEAIATENAVEGCVAETYGALLALHQAAESTDLGVRRAMTRIAADEARHAALAWDVASWLETRLDPAERGRVAEARRAAVARLEASMEAPPPADLRETAGLPSSVRAARMVAGLRDALWS
jgi:hypothetical protein